MALNHPIVLILHRQIDTSAVVMLDSRLCYLLNGPTTLLLWTGVLNLVSIGTNVRWTLRVIRMLRVPTRLVVTSVTVILDTLAMVTRVLKSLQLNLQLILLMMRLMTATTNAIPTIIKFAAHPRSLQGLLRVFVNLASSS